VTRKLTSWLAGAVKPAVNPAAPARCRTVACYHVLLSSTDTCTRAVVTGADPAGGAETAV